MAQNGSSSTFSISTLVNDVAVAYIAANIREPSVVVDDATASRMTMIGQQENGRQQSPQQQLQQPQQVTQPPMWSGFSWQELEAQNHQQEDEELLLRHVLVNTVPNTGSWDYPTVQQQQHVWTDLLTPKEQQQQQWALDQQQQQQQQSSSQQRQTSGAASAATEAETWRGQHLQDVLHTPPPPTPTPRPPTDQHQQQQQQHQDREPSFSSCSSTWNPPSWQPGPAAAAVVTPPPAEVEVAQTVPSQGNDKFMPARWTRGGRRVLAPAAIQTVLLDAESTLYKAEKRVRQLRNHGVEEQERFSGAENPCPDLGEFLADVSATLSFRKVEQQEGVVKFQRELAANLVQMKDEENEKTEVAANHITQHFLALCIRYFPGNKANYTMVKEDAWTVEQAGNFFLCLKKLADSASGLAPRNRRGRKITRVPPPDALPQLAEVFQAMLRSSIASLFLNTSVEDLLTLQKRLERDYAALATPKSYTRLKETLRMRGNKHIQTAISHHELPELFWRHAGATMKYWPELGSEAALEEARKHNKRKVVAAVFRPDLGNSSKSAGKNSSRPTRRSSNGKREEEESEEESSEEESAEEEENDARQQKKKETKGEEAWRFPNPSEEEEEEEENAPRQKKKKEAKVEQAGRVPNPSKKTRR